MHGSARRIISQMRQACMAAERTVRFPATALAARVSACDEVSGVAGSLAAQPSETAIFADFA